MQNSEIGTFYKKSVEIRRTDESRTGYRVIFRFWDEKATNVRLIGGFTFYPRHDVRYFSDGYLAEFLEQMNGYNLNAPEGTIDAALTYAAISPEDWSREKNLVHIYDGAYKKDMIFDEIEQVWTASVDLTGGYYLYQFAVSYDNGVNYFADFDPENPPLVNRKYDESSLVCDTYVPVNRSSFYVPYCKEKQPPNDDHQWIAPINEPEYKSTLHFVIYPGLDSERRPLFVSLPPHYDSEREKPYKVLYLCHPGGSMMGDWIEQGKADLIADRLVKNGECEEFIIAAMELNSFDKKDKICNWDYDKIYKEFMNCLIPYMEHHFHVSKQPGDRAVAGSSKGGMVAGQIWYRDPQSFASYGIFSAAEPYHFPELPDYNAHKKSNVFLASGFADGWLLKGYGSKKYEGGPQRSFGGEEDVTMIGMAKVLSDHGIPFNNGKGIYIADGSHDWFSWQKILYAYLQSGIWR